MQRPDRRTFEQEWLRPDLANNEAEAADIGARLAAGEEHPSVLAALEARATHLERESEEIRERLAALSPRVPAAA